MTWVLNIWNVIFLIWVIAGSVSGAHQANKDCAHPGVLTRQECLDASHTGTGIGVALIIILWFLGFVVLALVWFMTRGKSRQCPHCGEDVKKGRTACKKCGYDFVTGTNPRHAAASSGDGASTAVAATAPPPPDRQATPQADTPSASVVPQPATGQPDRTEQHPTPGLPETAPLPVTSSPSASAAEVMARRRQREDGH